VHEHRESTARQYALQQRAVELGWAPHQVEVLDQDLGQSGATTHGRQSFQRLAQGVAEGQLGIILALEVSRLARSSADWHRLLELCGLADVLIADEQAVYCPNDYNDRLLLGLKGTMSEAEQYWMRLRLQGGKLNKARRGALFFHPPTGYVWDPQTARFVLDPDEQVQRAVRLVFARFRVEGSAYAVMRYLESQGLKLPARRPGEQEVAWICPRHSMILGMLKNPLYTGSYVFGRRQERMALVNGQLRRRRVTRLARDAWKVVLPDHHPAYLSWEEFMANQRKLMENRTCPESGPFRGAARQGHALLQGLVLCGRCGHRMTVCYQGTNHRGHYECRSANKHTGTAGMCWSVTAQRIDAAVEALFLQTVQPPELELSLQVLHQAEAQAQEVDRQWKLRLERLRYEARLSERRYKAVDPDNRVVARTLEREWNDKLQQLQQLEAQLEQARREKLLALTPQDRARILALAKDLGRVFYAPTTTQAERKNLLRMLVREVTLSPIDSPQRATRIQVLWETGATTELTVPRPDRITALATPQEAIEQIKKLLQSGASNQDIAQRLNDAGLRTGRNEPWTAHSVGWAQHRYRLGHPMRPPRSQRQPDRRPDGLYSVHGVAAFFHTTEHIVRYWMSQGWLRGAEGGGPRPWWFKLDRDTIKRLHAAQAHGYGPKRGRNSQSPA